jgi:hypothetical protein
MFHCVMGASNTTIKITKWTKLVALLHEYLDWLLVGEYKHNTSSK